MNQSRDTHKPEIDEEEPEMIIIQSAEEIPQFKDEDEEDAFWETHSLASHFFTERGLRPGSLAAKIAERRAVDQRHGI